MTDYDELARRAEAGELTPKGNTLRGSAAAENAQRMLMEATGTDTLDAAVTIARGRPRLDTVTPPDVTWRVRATPVLNDQARAVAASRGISLSQLIRDAVLNSVQTSLSDPASSPPR